MKTPHTNHLGQPVGAPLPDWTPPPLPAREAIAGAFCRLEPLSAARHGADLFEALQADPQGTLWTHRLVGPFDSVAALMTWIETLEADPAVLHVAYVDQGTGRVMGNGAFMAMAPAAGSIEVGAIMFAPAMQRTAMATEAIYLMMRHAFQLGYRRLEWTCDPLNAASMNAAIRFGFSYEATFRQAYVSKGRNRDKAIFSVLDHEWPALRRAFEAWLDPINFDDDGRQRQSLSTLTAPLVSARPPRTGIGETNAFGQPVDRAVPDWSPPPRPTRAVIEGRLCRLEPLSPDHVPDLFAAHARDAEGRNWTYMPTGPFGDRDSFAMWAAEAMASNDPLHVTIITDLGPIGTASFLRIAPEAGSIEVGYIAFSPLLQRTPAATEAMFLMMQWAFDAGYRRYEWKCNALNAPSRAAAQRLGLSYEGIFRQAMPVKGANRDSAWFAAIDSEWPGLKAAFETWLDPANFDADGRQRQSLRDLTRPILVREDPDA